MILPVTLRVQVQQFMYLEKYIILQRFRDVVPEHTDKICIIRRSGHYDILCDSQEMELEQFHMGRGQYFFYPDEEYYRKIATSRFYPV